MRKKTTSDIFEVMQLLQINNLYDRYDFKPIDIQLYTENFKGITKDYLNGKFTISDFKAYDTFHNNMATNMMRTIPTSYKLRMLNKRKVDLRLLRDAERIMTLWSYINLMIFKEIFEYSEDEIKDINSDFLDYIDSYCSKQPICKEPWFTKADIINLITTEIELDPRIITIKIL